MERGAGKAVVEFGVWGVLLLVQDCADSEKVGLVYWCYGAGGMRKSCGGGGGGGGRGG